MGEAVQVPANAPAGLLLKTTRLARCLRVVVATCLGLLIWTRLAGVDVRTPWPGSTATGPDAPFGRFPLPGDPFHFVPCTDSTVPPPLDSADPLAEWRGRFDPDPSHWSWTSSTPPDALASGHRNHADDRGRGIFLCGYLDVPLDYTNPSDGRIARLAVTKLQVSGLADSSPSSPASAPVPGSKSERTIVIEPGGPGGSGTSFAWRSAADITRRLSGGRFDVLGWDPRGVNQSQPAAACYPSDAHRDRWSQLEGLYREDVGASTRQHLERVDAANDAVFRACWERLGDLGRFLGTASVARDLESIRVALDEDELTGYLVSYGTGIGQTYANMFPDRVGRIILDGTEYVRDHRELAGFGWTALDNATDAWRDGFLGECISAGPEHCALATPKKDADAGGGGVTLSDLEARMGRLLSSVQDRPLAGYSAASGPTLISYSRLVAAVYSAMYSAATWPGLAQVLSDLEDGNTTLAAQFLEDAGWQFNPAAPCPVSGRASPASSELFNLVVCADSYDAPPQDLGWWDELWATMAAKSWIAGNSRFLGTLPCRHFSTYWPQPSETYRGDLNHTLKHPVLLVAEVYDPATPLRNGRRLLGEMGWANARLVVHHGYGHSSRDRSACTDALMKDYILGGTAPASLETDCYADEKPYLYGIHDKVEGGSVSVAGIHTDPLQVWHEHMQEMALWNAKILV